MSEYGTSPVQDSPASEVAAGATVGGGAHRSGLPSVQTSVSTAERPAVLSGEDGPSRTDVAKGEAAAVKETTAGAAQQVKDVTAEQLSTVAQHTGRQVKSLVGQTQGELRQQASTQQQRVAGGLRSLADELHTMVNGVQEQGVASDVANQAGQKAQAVASWLEEREPGDLLEEVRTFARRRPVAFLALAAATGVLAGRLTRSLAAGPPGEGTDGLSQPARRTAGTTERASASSAAPVISRPTAVVSTTPGVTYADVDRLRP